MFELTGPLLNRWLAPFYTGVDSWVDFDSGLAAIGLTALLDGLWLEHGLDPDTFTPAEAVLICEAWIDGLLAGGFRRFCVQAQRTG